MVANKRPAPTGSVPDGQSRPKRAKTKKSAATAESTPEQPKPKLGAASLTHLAAPSSIGEDNSMTEKGINDKLPPLSDIGDIFLDMANKAWSLGLRQVIEQFDNRPLRVATLCSGTESPILAIQEISLALQIQFQKKFNIEHLYSVEIEPYKQAYIERNFAPKFLFRDVTELADGDKAHTAYAGRHEVPCDGDIWIAGASCVDFSNLNIKKDASLESEGESADTFKGVVRAVARWRPPIVILENVLNAPWDVLKAVMENDRQVELAIPLCTEIWTADDPAYVALAVRADTKLFYLPHTRQRGYMICFNRTKFLDAEEALAKCLTVMQGLQRYPSASVEHFVLPESDPRVRAVKLRHNGTGKISTQIDWKKCAAKHSQIRTENKLGNQHPVTHWKANAGSKPLDFMWRDWIMGQVERIRDYLDCAQLMMVDSGYDAFGKSKIWDLSQSIDRIHDHSYHGISPCLTPCGIPFLTSRGGPITGLESLALQGLPIDRLILKDESDRDLQNLAGNAMSSTVVGAAILAALVAGLPLLKDRLKARKPIVDEGAAAELSMDTRYLRPITPEEINKSKKMDAGNLIALAKKSALFCYCETPSSKAKARLQKCRECGHTTCQNCGHYPKHQYQAYDPPRTASIEFDQAVRKALPFGLQFSTSPDAILQNLLLQASSSDQAPLPQNYFECVRNAFADQLHFAGTTCTRRRSVLYEGSHSRLILEFQHKQTLWKLYAKPDIDWSERNGIQELLEHPVARMSVLGDNLLAGNWEFCVPTKETGEIRIKGSGQSLDSYSVSVGLESKIGSIVWSRLDITVDEDTKNKVGAKICGRYSALPGCGMSMGSLYKRNSTTEKESSIFLFLDQDPVGHIKKDSFVFSTNKDRLDPKEKRETIAKLDSAYRLSEQKEEVVSYSSFGNWHNHRISLEPLAESNSIQYSVIEPPRLDKFSIDGCSELELSGSLTNESDCKKSVIAFLECKLPRSASQVVQSAKNFGRAATSKTLAKQLENLHGLGILIEPLRGLSVPSIPWQKISIDKGYENCTLCAPRHPTLKWTQRDKRPKVIGAPVTEHITVPFEDGTDAARYERELKARPPPLVVQTEETSLGGQHLKFGINIVAMTHRLLQRTKEWPDVVIEYQIDTTADALTQHDSYFTPFTLLDNKKDPESFVKLPGKPLRPAQSRSLTWMIKQEEGKGTAFTNQEVEECVIGKLDWRADVRASATMKIRGGILADEVGFGKTALSLAIHYARSGEAEEHARTKSKGLIRVKATLIIVPYHLTNQWEAEVKQFLGPQSIVLIKRAADLKKKSIAEVQNANLIIVSSAVFNHDLYKQGLSHFAALPDGPELGSRAFDRWFGRAIPRIKDHAHKLQELGPKGLKSHLQKEIQDHPEKRGTELELPTRRLRGAAYKEKHVRSLSTPQDSVSDQAADSPSMEEAPEDDSIKATKSDAATVNQVYEETQTDNVTSRYCHEFLDHETMGEVKLINLHLFHFYRIIEDEISYAVDHQVTLISSLKTKCRWLLSATLSLGSFSNVSRLSSFLGLPLGAREDMIGVLKHRNILRVRGEKTDAEAFKDFMAESHSPYWHMQQHKLAQSFLDTFVRRNCMHDLGIKMQTHLCIVRLPVVEYLDYKDFHMRATSQQYTTLRTRVKNENNERSRRILNSVKDSSSSTEALLTRCSFPIWCLGHEKNQGQEAEPNTEFASSFEEIIQLRENESDASCTKLNELIRYATILHLEDSRSRKPLGHFDTWKAGIEKQICGDQNLSARISTLIVSEAKECEKMDEDQMAQEVSLILSALATAQEAKKKKPVGKKAAAEQDTEQPESSKQAIQKKNSETAQEIAAGKAAAVKHHLKETVKQLSIITSEYLLRFRGHRYAANSDALQLAVGPDNMLLECDGCSGFCQARSLVIVGTCGHLLCEICVSDLQESDDNCKVSECSAPAIPQFLSNASPHQPKSDHTPPKLGAKLDDLVDLIENRIYHDDQIILFVQVTDHVGKVSRILEQAGIKCLALSSRQPTGHASKLTKFQKSKAKTCKVFILSCTDVSIAGSNLTNANHLVFLSPVPATAKEQWDTAYTQAIGRARRFGQTKEVHVYHYLALNTIDVDLHEQWEDKKLHESSKTGGWLLSPLGDLNEEEKKQDWGSGFFKYQV